MSIAKSAKDGHGALTVKIAMQVSLALLREETSSAWNWKRPSSADVNVVTERIQTINTGRSQKYRIVTAAARVFMVKKMD